jgi:hypothetical protein
MLAFVHLFVTERTVLELQFVRLRAILEPDGMMLVSWPKKTASTQTDIDESTVRKIGFANGVVDVKQCSVDETWTALKFVYRLVDRRHLVE